MLIYCVKLDHALYSINYGIGLWTLFYNQRGGQGMWLIRETKLPMQELELKMQGGV